MEAGKPQRGDDGGLRMAARGIKPSSLTLDMKAPIALDGVHKAIPEQELL